MANIIVPIAIRDLVPSDLDGMGWSGSPSHLSSVRAELSRVASGAVEYLAACPASDLPVGKLGIDYVLTAGAGTIYQAAVHPALQSCGIGTLLVAAAEQRILARGRSYSELAVEQDNPRARALYERLGYLAYADQRHEWDAEGVDGSIVRYVT
jgi:ribosomal protein S18 acetylase RimI-like enzyme